jgi:hypothetical protein
MIKQKYLLGGEDFNAEVLTLASFADAMSTTLVIEQEGEEKKETFPYKKEGESLMKKCRDLFKKGQAHMNSMFKSDNKTSYSELNFDDHFKLYKGRASTSSNHEDNFSKMNDVCLKVKKSTKFISPQVIHFDSGAKWKPTAADMKRQNSMLKIVGDIEKMLS